MSRSVHTRPLRVRAALRVRAPFAPRGQGDARRARASRRRLKLQGLVPEEPLLERQPSAAWLPRVIVRLPRPGHVHPATRADVEAVLLQLGPTFHYGLRSVELVRGDAGDLALGRFVAVGRILLFDLPLSPWRVRLRPEAAERLARAGARASASGTWEWPDLASLRWFVLHHVLLHELGHHRLQHHRGKRHVRVARTRAHECHAELVAERARALLLGRPG